MCKSLITSRCLEIITFNFYHKTIRYYEPKIHSYPLAGVELED